MPLNSVGVESNTINCCREVPWFIQLLYTQASSAASHVTKQVLIDATRWLLAAPAINYSYAFKWSRNRKRPLLNFLGAPISFDSYMRGLHECFIKACFHFWFLTVEHRMSLLALNQKQWGSEMPLYPSTAIPVTLLQSVTEMLISGWLFDC